MALSTLFSGKNKAHKLLTYQLFEKAVIPGTTSRLTRRKCLFSWARRSSEHINRFVRLAGLLSRGQPDLGHSKKFMVMLLLLFLALAPRQVVKSRSRADFTEGLARLLLLKPVGNLLLRENAYMTRFTMCELS